MSSFQHHPHSGSHAMHTHTHQLSVGRGGHLNRVFQFGIWLNVGYVILEAIFGFFTDSMGLLSDAGHNLSDIFSLLIALIAFKVARRKPTSEFTYGFRRATVNASVLNAIILYVAVAMILVESIRKLFHPVAVDGTLVAWIAAAGVAVNGITAWLFLKDSKDDLNVRGAFLHMAADTLVSVGVVISGIIMVSTGWTLIDPIVGIIIAIVIAIGTYGTLRESLRLAFDGVPRGICPENVAQAILSVSEVKSIHHLHIWALSTTEVAMTVHVVVDKTTNIDLVIHDIRHVAIKKGIDHSTIEVETTLCHCESCDVNQ